MSITGLGITPYLFVARTRSWYTVYPFSCVCIELISEIDDYLVVLCTDTIELLRAKRAALRLAIKSLMAFKSPGVQLTKLRVFKMVFELYTRGAGRLLTPARPTPSALSRPWHTSAGQSRDTRRWVSEEEAKQLGESRDRGRSGRGLWTDQALMFWLDL